jgi:hypothetical protein
MNENRTISIELKIKPSYVFYFYSPLVLPSHLAFMHSKLFEVVQPLHLVKLTKTQLTFSLWEEFITIIIRVFL